MARFMIFAALFALVAATSAHRWGRRRFNCRGCFTDYGAYQSCAPIYSASGAPCGTQGVKSRRREYATDASADCLSKCKREELIQYEKCTMIGQAACVEGLTCDFSNVTALDIRCKPVIAATTQYSLGIPDSAVSGASALTINTAISSSPDAYGYYFVGPFQAGDNTPDILCLQITYKLPRNVVLKVLKLQGDFGTSSNVDGEMRRALAYHDRDHHYIMKDYHGADMTVPKTVNRNIRAGESFKIGFVAFPPNTANTTLDIVTMYSINEGKCIA